jgi:ATP-dependent protease ClpP protease subunit
MFKFILACVLTLFTSAALAENKLVQLRPENMLLIRGEVSDQSMAEASEKLVALAVKRGSARYTIYIVLDTPGGDVVAGNEFIEFAKMVPNVETVTLFAASMGAAIVEALPGTRNITENGTLMFHRAKGGFQGQFEDGEVESRLDYAKQIIRSMEQRNADRMSMSLPDYKAGVVNEMWHYGRNAISKKSADAVVDLICNIELISQVERSTMTIFGILQVTVESSRCPLLKGMRLVKPDREEQEALEQYLENYKRGMVAQGAKYVKSKAK